MGDGSLRSGLHAVASGFRHHRHVSGHAWFLIALTSAAVVGTSYALTHSYPASYGGLFLEVIERIRRTGFAYPTHIPGFTNQGIPWAYPPLVFYLDALLTRLLPFSGLEMARFLPPAFFVLSIVPYFRLATRCLGSRRRAGVASFTYAVTPAAFEWIITGGGIIRAPALLLALTGLYTGVELFDDGDRRWLVASTVLFGLTLLSHPVLAFGFGLSYLYFFIALDRTPVGFARGAFVAAGGLVIASPWILTILSVHGPTPFLSALGVAGGGYTVNTIPPNFWDPFGRFFGLYYIFAALGGAILLARGDWMVPGWVPVLLLSLTHLVLWFVPAAMLAATFIVEFVDRLREEVTGGQGRSIAGVVPTLVLSAVLVHGILTGSIYAAGYPQLEHAAPMRESLDAADVEAMAWLRAETAPDATVAVVGEEGEWLPYIANRTSTLAWWGLEWGDPQRRNQLKTLYSRSLRCDNATCFADLLSSTERGVRYLYVTRDRLNPAWTDWSGIRRSLVESAHFRVAFENERVVIVAVRDGPRLARAT